MGVVTLAATPVVNEEVELFASDGATADFLGGEEDRGIAISGNTLVAGAWGDDDDGNQSGSVYVFGPDGSGGWTEEARLTPTDGGIGDSGSVYLFQADGSGGWTETGKILASDQANSDVSAHRMLEEWTEDGAT